MNHAIDFQSNSYDFVTTTARKKTLHNQLIRVEEGQVIVRLGKNEYLYQAGELFWLPFDCLTSLTMLPHTKLSTVKFSIRLRDKFPGQAGHVNATPLTSAILDRLITASSDVIKNDLLQVLRHEVAALSPALALDNTSENISRWTPGSNTVSGELALVLLVREARKLKLSGKKPEAICEQLFAGNQAQFQQLTQTLLGSEL
jgi:hypothetical protein